jgi:rod shape-determining protein MreC
VADIAFALVTVDASGGGRSPLEPLRIVGAQLFGPAERAGASASRPVAGLLHALGEFGQQTDQIAALRRENERLRAEVQTARIDVGLARQLKSLLGSAGNGHHRIVPARVVAFGPEQGFSRTVAIDVGRRDGVRRDMTVVNGDGLVGRVVGVGPHTSNVLLAVDPTSTIGVRVTDQAEIGAVTGAARGSLRLQMLDQHAPLARGAQLVTFGSLGGRPFIPGVPVGEVLQAQSTRGSPIRSVTVRPYVDYTALDVVGVVVEPPRTSKRSPLPAEGG